MNSPYICRTCRAVLKARQINGALKRSYTRPSFAPKPILNIKHMRQNPGLYEQNAIDRNYPAVARNAWKILEMHEALSRRQKEMLETRRRNNEVGKSIQQQATSGNGSGSLLEEARKLKEELKIFEEWEKAASEEMLALAMDMPNLSSHVTPSGDAPTVIGHVNGDVPPRIQHGKSHVDIGLELDIIDFESSATTSGWGWYFLKNEGALLEQALIQYALAVAMRRGWSVQTPPSLVYEHIASACGFQPRDQNGETQRYEIAGNADDQAAGKPALVLAGTAEIPFAGSKANRTLQAKNLPLKVIGPSRCYRAEAGARGIDTKGLYRVHEFTKVEMFAWTAPPEDIDTGDRFGSSAQIATQADHVFDDMLDIQKEIVADLGLHARILEMPSTDLGAAATRKIDIEAFFPSRGMINAGYGEITSASMCTDYQTRRLGTRFKDQSSGKLGFPYTLNGTAIAIPRMLACILENHWDEDTRTVRIPACLHKWMPTNITTKGSSGAKP